MTKRRYDMDNDKNREDSCGNKILDEIKEVMGSACDFAQSAYKKVQDTTTDIVENLPFATNKEVEKLARHIRALEERIAKLESYKARPQHRETSPRAHRPSGRFKKTTHQKRGPNPRNHR